MKDGQGAIWQAVAPAGLMIVGAQIPNPQLQTYGVGTGGTGYAANFYWGGGQATISPNQQSIGIGPIWSNYFGWLLVCTKSSCSQQADLQVFQVNLYVREMTPPGLVPGQGIWQSQGWIRGRWALTFSGDSPSGMCGLEASLAHSPLPGSQVGPDSSQWHQCAAPPVNDQVVTNDYPQGPQTLQILGWDAAGETVGRTKTIGIDNEPPTVTLSGPSDAPSTAGVQHVAATATAGPSGVHGIACSTDGGPVHLYPGASAQVPVSGIGQHSVRCTAQNNALDAAGVRGQSAAQTFSMKIGTPTVSAIGFAKIVNGLRCHTVSPRRRASRRNRSVTHCHVRTARRRVTIWVWERRGGRRVRVRVRRVIRVVLTPHIVRSARKWVPHGHPTTVSGWLGTVNGVALGGQVVKVLTAPADGRSDYTVAAITRTEANGSWSVRLAPGPSRAVSAEYGGGPTTESSLAAPVHVVVPARVELLSVSPRRVPWGGTVRLVGRLGGGYLPPGGALVRLRIGLGHAFTTFGVRTHVGGRGRFSTLYTFGAGFAAIHRAYWFQVASLPMGDYPYAPSASRRVTVMVGGHPVRGGRRHPNATP